MTLQRKQIYWVAGISALVALLAVWTFAIEWEWTMNGDDAGFVQTSRAALASGGVLGLVTVALESSFAEPTTSGRFRPMYLLYSQFAYLLPPDLMRGLRMVSILVVLISLVRLIPGDLRGPAKTWAFIWVISLYMSNYTLFFGLQFASFQELTGVTLIAIGLLNRNLYWQSTWFVLAALTKEPFIPLLFLFALYLLHQRKRAAAITLIVIGVVLALPILLFSGDGSYTQGAFGINPWHYWSNIQSLVGTGAPTVLIMVLGLIALKDLLKFNWRSLTFIGAGAAYAGVLLFWWAGGYYTAPVWYLLTVGLVLALVPTVSQIHRQQNYLNPNPSRLSKSIISTSLTAGLFAAALLLAETFRSEIIGWNTTYVEARDWVLNDLPTGARYYLYDLNPSEFDFYLKEKDPTYQGEPSIYWRHNDERPREVDLADYVIASTTVAPNVETARCPAIKVWTKGFIAPTRC